jgi:predicted ABC-type transport system involved in lysophospholipase L1 biosynthesis ATPase subunit
MGFIFQSHNLIPFLTVRQNVLFPLDLVGLKGPEAQARVTELLDSMEIAERAEYLPALLSGGEEQRVAIARALATGPNLSWRTNLPPTWIPSGARRSWGCSRNSNRGDHRDPRRPHG